MSAPTLPNSVPLAEHTSAGPRLADSYALCRQTARRAASNFYFSFRLLPPERRDAMCALYAFLRHTDDLSDAEQPVDIRRENLQAWRRSLERALAGTPEHPLLPALIHTVQRFEIPPAYLFDAITGVGMDFDRHEYDTFTALENYCYHVASVVGLACIHIWGYTDAAALAPARQCGIAFQLTNILRDLEEDAQRGRIYLPREDLDRFGYPPEALRRGERNDTFRQMMRFEIERAERFYDEAASLDRWLAPEGRAIFRAMSATYRGLLAEIKRRDGDVWRRRVRLPRWRKAAIALRSLPTLVRVAVGGNSPGSRPA